MAKVYIINQKSSDDKYQQIIYYGTAADKPSLAESSDYEHVPSSSPPPDGKTSTSDYKWTGSSWDGNNWSGGSWEQSQEILSSNKKSDVEADEKRKCAKYDTPILIHQEELKLLDRKDVDDAVALTGTVSFTNGSTAITGTSTSFTTELVAGRSWVKLDSDGKYYLVSSITDNTNATLRDAYEGTTDSGTSSEWRTTLTDTQYKDRLIYRKDCHRILNETELSGTSTFTNGSTTVTGSGTSYTSEVTAGEYIKPDSGIFYKVSTVDSDTQITLTANFQENTDSDATTYLVCNLDSPTWPSEPS